MCEKNVYKSLCGKLGLKSHDVTTCMILVTGRYLALLNVQAAKAAVRKKKLTTRPFLCLTNLLPLLRRPCVWRLRGVGTIEKYNTFHSCVQLRPTMDNCCWIFLSRFMSSFIYIRTLFLVETIAKIRSPVLKNVQPLKKLPSFWFNICTCLHCFSIQKNFWVSI